MRVLIAGRCTSVVSGKMAAKGRRISGDTLEILKEFSRRGMNSSGKACHPLIVEASSRTGLTEQQVKVWILNQRRKDKPAKSPAKCVPKRMHQTGFHVFQKEQKNDPEMKKLSLTEHSKECSSRWRNLSSVEQQAYRDMAQERKTDASSLSVDEKHKEAQKAMDRVIKELAYFEAVGGEAVALFWLDGKFFHGGSAEGKKFLTSTHAGSQFVAQMLQVSTQLPVRRTREELIEEVKSMFLRKYNHATGKEYQQVPYSHEDMHVDGLPPGVDFCNPRLYNRHQLECIMKAEHSITFVRSNPGVSQMNDSAVVNFKQGTVGRNGRQAKTTHRCGTCRGCQAPNCKMCGPCLNPHWKKACINRVCLGAK